MKPPVATSEDIKKALGLRPSGAPGNGDEPGNWRYPSSEGAIPPPPAKLYRVGMFTVILAVTMTFFVLCSAYVFLVAQPHVWKPITMPWLVWVSTALILLSSYALIRARRMLVSERTPVTRNWLTATLLLGIGFLVSQIGAWIQLSRGGLFETGNQQRSFFLILSVTHGVHVLGGLLGLIYLCVRALGNRPANHFPLSAAVKTIGQFWHFMAGIWLFVLTLLLVWK